MSALYAFSCMIGKAMHLPPVFYKKLPLSSILDTRIPIPPIAMALPFSLQKKPKKRRIAGQSKRKPDETGRRSVAQPIVLEGPVSNGNGTRFAINGMDFSIAPGTWIIGDLRLGVCARVKGQRAADSCVEAASIVILQTA